MPDVKYISKVVLPSGEEYEVKDLGARELIEDLESYSDYLGVTSTALTDGATTNPIIINEESVVAKKGNIVNYGAKEFIWNGSVWQEFGDLSALGALAYEDTADVAGTAAAQVFTGTEATITSTLTGGEAQSVVTGIGDATTATIKEFDNAGSVTAGSAATFTQGADVFTAEVATGTETLTLGFTQGTDDFTANTPTAVTLPTSKETSVVTAQGTAVTGDITIPTGATATYTPAGTNATSAVTGTASAPVTP